MVEADGKPRRINTRRFFNHKVNREELIRSVTLVGDTQSVLTDKTQSESLERWIRMYEASGLNLPFEAKFHP